MNRRSDDGSGFGLVLIVFSVAAALFFGPCSDGQPSSIEEKLNHLFTRIAALEETVQRQQKEIDAFRPCLNSTGKLDVVLVEEN